MGTATNIKYYWTWNPTPNTTDTPKNAPDGGGADNAQNKNWLKSMCRTGTLTVRSEFLPAGRSNIQLNADSKDPKNQTL